MFDTPVGSGTNYAIVGAQSGRSLYGALSRSIDGRFLTISAANVPADTGTSALIGGPFGTVGFPNRTIARIDADGAVDTTTRFAGRGTTPNGVVSTDGTNLWWAADSGSGDAGGVRYLTLGSTVAGPQLTGVGVSTASRSNTRGVGIYADQLYVSYNISTFRGVYSLGSGLPQSGGPLTAAVVVSATAAEDFYFADANTLYVAVSSTDTTLVGLGLQKWIKSGSGVWTNAWASNPANTFGIVGVTGSVSGGLVDVYAVTSGTSTSAANSLVAIADTLSGTSFPSGGFTTLATPGPNSLFRGVALAPVPEPSTLMITIAGAAGIGLILRRRSE